MHKFLLYINTDIFLPTRRKKKKKKKTRRRSDKQSKLPRRRWAGTLALWSPIKNVIFLLTVQVKSSDSTWWPEQVSASVRREVTSGFLLLCWRSRFPESAEQLLSLIVFFPPSFTDLFGTKNPPGEVLPAVKQEVKSFKLLLPPVWAVVMSSGTPAVRGNVSVIFFFLVTVILFCNFYVSWNEHWSRGNSKLRMGRDDIISGCNAIG